jgi:predicted alpha/beta hydrolase
MGAGTVDIPAVDGYPLGAHLHPAGSSNDWMIVNPAFGVPAGYYAAFADAASDMGYNAVTYDYRGVGGSAPSALRGFEATLGDWATLDMAGVVDWVRSRGPRRVVMYSHSLGGILAGLMGGDHPVDAMVTVGSENTYWRYRRGRGKYVALGRALLTPMLTAIFGYMPWSRFSAAEDVPSGAIRQMARSIRHRGGLLDDPALPVSRYAEFTAPVLAISIADDPEATERSVDDLARAYPHVQRRHLEPDPVGIGRVGHFGFFRPGASPLWPGTLDWLRERE